MLQLIIPRRDHGDCLELDVDCFRLDSLNKQTLVVFPGSGALGFPK